MSMATTGTIWTRRTIHVYTDGNPGSTRNQFSYCTLLLKSCRTFSMRRKFSIGAGCQLCRILWVRAHRMSCLGWKGDKNRRVGFYLRKAGRPNLPENVALDIARARGIRESGITSTPGVANAVFHSTEKRVREPTANSRQAALSSYQGVGRVCPSGSAPLGAGRT